MAKMDSPAPADNYDSTGKELDRCKELIINIPRERGPRGWPDECCIYRVPKRLRDVQKMAYTPRLVSIGPFHHRRKELKNMEKQKRIYFWDFCDRTGKSIEDLKSIIVPIEQSIRHCYSESFDHLSSKEFIKMILLDAIFILELFWRKYEKLMAHENNSENPKAYEKDYILSQPCMELGIQHDLLLLENQLPFSHVLEKLYQNGEPNTKKPTLLQLSCGFFGDLYYDFKPESKNDEVDPIKDLVNRCPQDRSVKHFTDLVRYFFLPQNPSPTSEPIEVKLRPCDGIRYNATKLGEAGLKFTKPDLKRDLLDINLPSNECLETFPCFNLSWLLSCLPFLKSDCLERQVQRCLEVPPLRVDDTTEDLFRNLMALEQCHYPDKTYICDYIVLLDDLITTEADVMLLVENEIIDNNLGSNAAVTKLFNNLGLEIALPPYSLYGGLCDSLNKYSKSNWNRLVGTLTKVYFSDFFKGTATVAGIIVLVVTLWNFISKRLGKD